MTYLPPEAHAVFERQHGVASIEQLEQSGLSRRQIELLERNGALVNLLRGAYRSPSVPVTELGRCAALCVARPRVAIAGPTAGRLHGFRRVSADNRIHLIAPPAAQPATVDPRVVTYRTAAIHARDVIARPDGIRVTSRARTALDLARSLRFGDLVSVIEQAMHDGATEAEMRTVAVDWVRGRPWVRRYLVALDCRLGGGAAESHPEVRVGRALRSAGVHGLVRQYRIELPGYGGARFDLAVPRLRWAIEVDVFPTHAELAGAVSDRRRDDAAARLGWVVSRITRARYEAAFDDEIRSLVARFHHLARPAA